MKICPVCRHTYPDEYESCPRDRSDLQAADAALAPGAVLRGKYEILSELGRGGMATVYKVRHLAFHDVLAVKVVHGELQNDEDFLKRFRNEAVVARQLKHPNAVHIEDFDYAEDGRPFIVMEYVEGRSIFELQEDTPGPWKPGDVLAIGSQVAAALGAAHAIGIVHRDIKPANILLTPGDGHTPQVKVLDFGIAKTSEKAFAGMTSVKTQASFVIGTPEYMSPEQAASGGDAGVDGRSDLYALGVVMYEMLTGSHPFRADTPIAMLVHQMQTKPEPPRSVHAGVPEAVSALVVKALEKKADERFQTAAEMLEAMEDPEAWWARERGSGSPAAEDFIAAEVSNAVAPPDESAAPVSAPAPAKLAEVPVQAAPPANAVEPATMPVQAPPPTPGLSAEDAASVANFGAGKLPPVSGRLRVPQSLPRASDSRNISAVRPAANPNSDPALARGSSKAGKGGNGKVLSFVGLLVLMIAVVGFYVHTQNQAAEHPEPTVQRPADALPAAEPESATSTPSSTSASPPAASSAVQPLPASGGEAVHADAQLCDGSACRSTFTRSVMRRVQLRLKLHRATSAPLQRVPLRAVLWAGSKAVSDRQLPPCVFAAGRTEVTCETAGALGKPAVTFHADTYRLEIYGDAMEHLTTLTVTVTD